jgi:D-glycero-alpha-D-manno-heptose-7-phosphate kinase
MINDIYDAARRAGAAGGKLLGAGGGGFMLLFAKPDTHARIKTALPGLLHVPFRFEGMGSQIVFYQQESPIAREMRWNDDKAGDAAPDEALPAGKAVRP